MRPKGIGSILNCKNPRILCPLFCFVRFQQIKADHLKKGTLFEDSDFPPDIKSIDPGNPAKYDEYDIKWLRPGEMFEKPALFIDDASQLDICQGMLG